VIIATFNLTCEILSGKPKSCIAMIYYTNCCSSASVRTGVAPLLRERIVPAKFAQNEVLGIS
jgi:hypothetical protein